MPWLIPAARNGISLGGYMVEDSDSPPRFMGAREGTITHVAEYITFQAVNRGFCHNKPPPALQKLGFTLDLFLQFFGHRYPTPFLQSSAEREASQRPWTVTWWQAPSPGEQHSQEGLQPVLSVHTFQRWRVPSDHVTTSDLKGPKEKSKQGLDFVLWSEKCWTLVLGLKIYFEFKSD